MTNPSFEQSRFDQLRELVDDVAELGSLIDEYVANSRGLLGQMQASLRSRSHIEMSRAAHTLKSSSALMGAAALASLCERLEALTRQGQVPPDAEQQVAAIEQRFNEAIRWLEEQKG